MHTEARHVGGRQIAPTFDYLTASANRQPIVLAALASPFACRVTNVYTKMGAALFINLAATLVGQFRFSRWIPSRVVAPIPVLSI